MIPQTLPLRVSSTITSTKVVTSRFTKVVPYYRDVL